MASMCMAVSFLIDILVFHLISLTPQPISPLYDFLYTNPSSHLCLISAIDYNQFTFFLLANISTGLVNFTVNTLEANSLFALLLIILHTVGVSLVIVLMKRLKIKVF